MRNRFCYNFIAWLLGVLALLFAFAGCDTTPLAQPTVGKIEFVVDGGLYATIETYGEEKLTLPEPPSKEEYTFIGWYFDEESWQTEFTEDTLLELALSETVSVYARWERMPWADEELQGTQVQLVGFEKTGEGEYSATVDNATESILLSKVLFTNSKSEWLAYTDADCTQLAALNAHIDRKWSLDEGENTIYVKVSSMDGETQVYALRVQRTQLFTVSFLTATGELGTLTVQEGERVQVPSWSMRGYTLTGWARVRIEDYVELPDVDEEFPIPPDEASNEASNENTVEDVEPDVEIPEWDVPVDDLPVLDTPVINFPQYPFDGYETEPFDFDTPITKDIVLVPLWKANTYTVTYEPNGGSLEQTTEEVVFDKAYAVPKPTRLGYDFAGWYDGNAQVKSGAWTIDKDVTLTAEWELEWYSISCDLDGGTAINPVHYSVESEEIVLSAPTKTGYTFKGWLEGREGEPQETVRIPKGSTGAKTYTAVWTVNTYTVEYVLDGGVNDALNPTSYQVTDGTVLLHAPTRECYDFGGWYLEEECNNRMRAIPEGTTENLRLYAKWYSIEYTVKFDKNNDKASGVMYSITLSYGTEYLVWGEFVYPGYQLAGWNTERDGSGQEFKTYENGATILNLAKEQGEVVTLYAQWEIWKGTVWLSANDGSGMLTSITAIGNEYFSLNGHTAPTLKGHTFTGYYDEAGVCYVNERMECVKAWDKQESTLFAGWRANVYTVHFEANGGHGEMGDQHFTYGEAETLRYNTFQRKGYYFGGWRRTEDGSCSCEGCGEYCYCYYDCECWSVSGECYVFYDGNEVSALTTADGETVTLYAIWHEVWSTAILCTTDRECYYVRFYPNGGSFNASYVQRVDLYSPLMYPEEPTRDGYHFAGWYDNPNCEGEPFDFSATVDKDVTLYAKWTEAGDLYTVDFRFMEGSEEFSDSIIVQHGTLIPYRVPASVKYGYVFAGWYDNPNCSGEPFNFYRPVTSLITLYAKWIWTGYDTIPLDGTEKEISFGDGAYTFAVCSLRSSWFRLTLSGECTVQFSIYDEYGNEPWTNTYDTENAVEFYLEEDRVYYIQLCKQDFDGLEYMASLHFNYGEYLPIFGGYAKEYIWDTVTLHYNTASYTLPILTKEGYAFQGWYDGMNGTGAQYTDALGNSLRPWDEAENVKLYAYWIPLEVEEDLSE